MTACTGGIASHFRYRVGAKHLPTFWKSYEELLRCIASARAMDGQPNFESNATTRLCEEIVQAEYLGSRWILALTLASAVESQARRLADRVPVSDSKNLQDVRVRLLQHIHDL